MTDVDVEPLVWATVFALLSFAQRYDVNCAACIALSAACAWLALVVPLILGHGIFDWEYRRISHLAASLNDR